MDAPILKDSQNREFVPVGGADGGPVPQSEFQLARRITYTSIDGNPYPQYVAEALPGSSTNSAVWRVYRITYSGTNPTAIQWADGNSNFDNQANNPSSLTYS